MRSLYLLLFVLLCLSCEETIEAPLEWQYGKNIYDMEIDGHDRNFLIHVPQLYSGDESVPVVMMLHGTGGTGNKFYNISRWVEQSDKHGFIAVFPTGISYPVIDSNQEKTKWSSEGLAKDLPPDYPIVDDEPFFREMVDMIKKSFNINEKRIYISGFSNGGGFVRSRVLKDMDDIFAAASSGGGLGIQENITPRHGNFMPLYSIMGTKDPKILESAGVQNEFPIQMENLLAIESIKERIDNQLAAAQLAEEYTEYPNPPSSNLIVYDNDLSGQGNSYHILLIKDMEHNYPNESNHSHGIVAAELLYEWYMQYELR